MATLTAHKHLDAAEAVRARAAALFDRPPPSAIEAEVAGSAEPAGPSRAARARDWAYVRCGLEPRTVAALAVLLIAAVGFAAYHFWASSPAAVAVPGVSPQPSPGPAPGPPPVIGAAKAGRSVLVDIAGKVRRPGVRKLPAGSRVADAVRAAGGALPGIDTSALNLARIVADGEQILVGAPAPPMAGTGPGASVSLSTATPEQLETLPGVGPVLARHIVDYRTQHGGFTSIDQLNEVTGIGDHRFADLKPLVTP